MAKSKKVKGRLVIQEIEFDKIWKKVVIKNNKTSGKILLPKELVGKAVYIVVGEK